MAKIWFYWLKIWRKFRYIHIYIYVYLSPNVQKHVYQEGRPWQPQTHDFCIFCSSHDIRALGILWMYRWIWKMFQFIIDIRYRFIFRESLAKVLLKPWRKTAFIWRLGGLNCGLAKASLQEYCSLGVEVSELADEGEQGPKYYAKTSNLNVQHCAATTEKLRWQICPMSCSILAWCTAKVKHGYGESLAKVNFLFS